MVLPHRPPTDDELTTLPRFEITSKQIWCPHHVYDDDTNTTTLDYSFDHVNSHIIRAQKLNKTDLPFEHPDIIRRSDESTVSSHSEHFDFSTVYDFGDLTNFDQAVAYDIRQIEQQSHHRQAQPNITDDATPNLSTPTDDPIVRIHTPMHNDIPQPNSLPSYRPASRVLEIFREPWPSYVPPDELHGTIEWSQLPTDTIDTADIPIQNSLQNILADPVLTQTYTTALQNALDHPRTEDLDITNNIEFHRSLDGGRFQNTAYTSEIEDVNEFFYDTHENTINADITDFENIPIPNENIDSINDDQKFYTARQNLKPHDRLTKAFHLHIDKQHFIRSKDVDHFLTALPDRELFGYNEPFDSYEYFSYDAHREYRPTTHANFMLTRAKPIDAIKLQPYLGFRPLEVVRRTLEQTTQLARLATGLPMRRHVKALFPFLNRKRIDETVATDTFFSSTRDVSGTHCAQIFYGLRSHFMNIYPLKTEADGPQAFDDFARYEGLPNVIRSDNSKMQRYSNKLLARLREWLVAAEFTEPHHPQQNPAELRAIRWIKKNIQVLRIRTGAPETVWYWMAKYLVDIHNVSADETLGWTTPWSKRRGETPDISAFLQFRFYEHVYYLDPDQKFPGTKEKTGYWLGVADHVGDRLCFHILTTDTHRVIERSVVRSASSDPNKTLTFPSDDFEPNHPVDPTHRHDHVNITQTNSVNERLNTPITRSRLNPPHTHVKHPTITPETVATDESSIDTEPMLRNRKRLRPPSHNSKPSNHNRPFVLRQRLRSDKRRAHLSRLLGPNSDIIHNSRKVYQEPELDIPSHIESPDYVKCFKGINHIRKIIRDYVISLDSESDQYDDDYETWTPLYVYKHHVTKHRGKPRNLRLRVGWQYHEPCWIDGDALRLQCPFLIIDYARRNKLTHLRDFEWVNTISTEDEERFTRAHATTTTQGPKYKFGELVPRSVAHAFEIDRMNNNTEWQDAIGTELKQINDYKTFRLLQKGEHLQDFQGIPYHIVFDVKFDLRKKARLVAGGNKTTPPKEDLYSGVVDLMTVRIGHMLAKANGLQVCAADIGNAFLYGKTREKVYIIAGREFGTLAGTPLIIDRGLYGLRSSSARFHEHLSTKLRAMGYRPSKADTDFWIANKGDHYEYVATYVDDVLVYSRDPMKVIQELQCDYILKGIGVPRYYLGGDILELPSTWQTGEASIHTALSAETYIENATAKYEKAFSTQTQPFTFRAYRAPMDHTYHSEEDTTEFLTPRQASVYRGLIGSANWIVTLGRFDIAFAVNNLARYCMSPRQGHFEAALHLFGYLKAFPKGRILIDQTPYLKPEATFTDYDWTEFYPDAEEELPPDMPPPLGQPMTTVCYVDADHAHDTITRRSVTGVLLFLNCMPVKWYSKRQKTVETSSYGSELVATRIAIELVQELRYKLRMLGVPIDRSTTMYGDNMAVILNTTVPSSQLKKKHNAIAYHRVREAIAAKIVQFAHIPSIINIADVLTKPLPVDTFQRLVTPILFRQPPNQIEPETPVIDTIDSTVPGTSTLQITIAGISHTIDLPPTFESFYTQLFPETNPQDSNTTIDLDFLTEIDIDNDTHNDTVFDIPTHPNPLTPPNQPLRSTQYSTTLSPFSRTSISQFWMPPTPPQS
jgi:hypothetical protein